MTTNQHIISIVPRHSKRPESLYQDWQKVRHAPLIAASETDYPDSGTLPPGLHSTPQRLLFFIAGPLVVMPQNNFNLY